MSKRERKPLRLPDFVYDRKQVKVSRVKDVLAVAAAPAAEDMLDVAAAPAAGDIHTVDTPQPAAEEVPAPPATEEVPAPPAAEVPEPPAAEEVPAPPAAEEVPAPPAAEEVPAPPAAEEVPAVATPLAEPVQPAGSQPAEETVQAEPKK